MNITMISKGLICFLGTCSFAGHRIARQNTHHFQRLSKSVSVRLINQSKTDPYLAQSWIEDKAGKNARVYLSCSATAAYRAGGTGAGSPDGAAKPQPTSSRSRVAVLLQHAGDPTQSRAEERDANRHAKPP